METQQSGTNSPSSASVDNSIASFLSSIESGKIAEGLPEERPTEVLVNPDGSELPDVVDEVIPEVVESKPIVPSKQTKPAEEVSHAQPEVPEGVKPGAKQTRDLSAFPAEAHNHLRQMSNSAVEWVKRSWRAQQTALAKQQELEARAAAAEKARDTWLYSHEEAYKLSPEYKQQEATVHRLGQEESYWRNALVALEDGQPIRDLELDNDGNLRIGERDIPPSAQVKAQVMSNLAKASQLRTVYDGKLRDWTSAHNTRLSQFRATLTEAPKQLFPNGVPDAFKPIMDRTLQAFPVELRGQQEYQMLAMANAFIQGLAGQVKQLQQQLSGKTAVRQTIKRQGPGDGAPAGNSDGTGSGGTVNDFLTRMRANLLS